MSLALSFMASKIIAGTDSATDRNLFPKALRKYRKAQPEQAQPETFDLLSALRRNVENTSTDREGVCWGSVYLANIKHPWTAHQFAGYLSSLESRGLYRRQDGYFGEVKL